MCYPGKYSWWSPTSGWAGEGGKAAAPPESSRKGKISLVFVTLLLHLQRIIPVRSWANATFKFRFIYYESDCRKLPSYWKSRSVTWSLEIPAIVFGINHAGGTHSGSSNIFSPHNPFPALNLLFKVVKVLLKVMYFFNNFSNRGVLFEQVIYTSPAVQNTEIEQVLFWKVGFL